jgi:hypothetical protein
MKPRVVVPETLGAWNFVNNVSTDLFNSDILES